MTTKVVYNACYGGFGLSDEAIELLCSLKGVDYVGDAEQAWDISHETPRHDKHLVAVVEQLGSKVNGLCAKLKITEIEGNLYRIDEYDGYESVETPSGVDWINALEE